MHFDLPSNELPAFTEYQFRGSSQKNKKKKNYPVPDDINPENVKNRKVLIVEDEILVAENLRETIQGAGYVVMDVVLSGEDAVKKFSQLDPDIVIMDVKLAGKLDGINAANLIHKSFKQVPIIFMSAYTEDHFPQISNLSPGSYLYINKLLDINKLLQTIERLLSKGNKGPN